MVVLEVESLQVSILSLFTKNRSYFTPLLVRRVPASGAGVQTPKGAPKGAGFQPQKGSLGRVFGARFSELLGGGGGLGRESGERVMVVVKFFHSW